MADKEKIVTILARGGTTAAWESVNPTPKNREFCVEETADGRRKFKIGDGSTPWNDLPYATTDELADLEQDATHRTVTDAEKAAWNAKQDALTFDDAPTAGSANPVKSSGVKTALDEKADDADLAAIAKSGKLSDATEDATHRVVTDTEKAAWNAKQSALTFDDAPAAGSNNPVKSSGIKTALDAKANDADLAAIAKSGNLADAAQDATHRVVTDTEKAAWNAKQSALTFDTTPTANSSNPVTSGGVKTALDAKAAKSEIVKTSTGLTDSDDLMRYTDTIIINGGGV